MSFIITQEDENLPKHTKKQHPIARQAWDYLRFKGLIGAGKTISKEHLEIAFQREYKKDDWNFLGPYLLLKNKIESEGYFITQRELEPPSFRILHSYEMAEFAHRKLMKNLASNYQIAYTMAAHDVSELNESQVKAHKRVQHQAAQSALLQQKMLLDDKYF